MFLSLEGGAAAPQRRQQHVGGHTLHPQLALLAALALTALLAGHIGDVGLLHLLLRQGTLEVIADDKARAVGIGQQNHAPPFRQAAEIGQLLLIPEHTEAFGGEDHSVHHLGKRVFVVAALHDDDLTDAGLHRAPANSIKNSFSSASLSIPRSLFMRRSSFWQRTTALLHQS